MNNRSTCNYITDTWTTNQHNHGCNEPTCPGCRPCEQNHCEHRGCSWHVNHQVGIRTCPKCINKTRRTLKDIVHLWADVLPEEAIESGIQSEAFNIIGPAHPYADKPDTHPLTVLGWWDLALREIYGPETTLRITVPRAADYLDGLLTGKFPHTNYFPEFATDITKCVHHLEAVAHDSRQPETGAPCPECQEGRLVKRYGPTDGDDTWHCPIEPSHWWTDMDYRLRVEGAYVKHANELPAAQLAQRIEVAPSTVRSWTSPTKHVTRGEGIHFSDPKLKPARKMNGQNLYSVEEAEALKKNNTPIAVRTIERNAI